MNSAVKKRSIVIDGYKTSVSLEDDFWACFRQIARERATTLSELIGMPDAERNGGNLSSTIRVIIAITLRRTRYCPQVEICPRASLPARVWFGAQLIALIKNKSSRPFCSCR